MAENKEQNQNRSNNNDSVEQEKKKEHNMDISPQRSSGDEKPQQP
ncbi:3-methyladenine DNA glycosylase [Bacillus lacus]|uniref:3-methyladenine DNA glycosylase n=1 Tax=Metabacillus lacus TaxID=1983721 RepID=A0A7X2J1S7_9BACI|nr:3-methyladenine DNA glycosylase [Metabacillus lacus]MRX73734.1 3-methyladenine DNA glycosylase [Metabacillus lacus]